MMEGKPSLTLEAELVSSEGMEIVLSSQGAVKGIPAGFSGLWWMR